MSKCHSEYYDFFQYNKVKIEVVATKTSLEFYDHKQVEAAGSRVWLDEDEWTVCFVYHRFSVLAVYQISM